MTQRTTAPGNSQELATAAQLLELARREEQIVDTERASLDRVLELIERLDDRSLMMVLTCAQGVRDARTVGEDLTLDEFLGWRPWTELRRRRNVELAWFDFPANLTGLCAWHHRDDTAVIMLATWLRGRQLDATLTHELTHEERRIPTTTLHGGYTDAGRAEESVVESITAERMARLP